MTSLAREPQLWHSSVSFTGICPKLEGVITYSYPASVANLTRLAALAAALPPGWRADLTLDGERVVLSLKLPQAVDEQSGAEGQPGHEEKRVVVAQQPPLGAAPEPPA